MGVSLATPRYYLMFSVTDGAKYPLGRDFTFTQIYLVLCYLYLVMKLSISRKDSWDVWYCNTVLVCVC